ncbi:MAG: HEAT repeat domain-containing protein [Fusobacterium sp.]|nr:HEAT repeat domain-containing protein [Fusobacterium sp.]
MNNLIKKLTGKNQSDYEPVAQQLINIPDISLFEELVKQDDFLFDFVKQNVANRLQKACNAENFRNLLALMKIYSPYYEEFITSTLAKFADEDLTDEILEMLENGTEEEKTYAAKYFARIQDPLALPLLNEYAFSENQNLAANCAATLGAFGDREVFNTALEKLKSDDDFEQFSAISFLISYGDKNAVGAIIDAMKNSSMAENIAGEIPYLVDMLTLLEDKDGLIVLNNIINGLGEILPLSGVFDYNLYEVFEKLDCPIVLLNAREKFNTLTENDEYLFDEDKNTKNEVLEIKQLLDSLNIDAAAVDGELREESPFVFTALELTANAEAVEKLLTSSNQTIVLKSAEVLKKLGAWNKEIRAKALNNITDSNIKSIIEAM